MTNDMIKEVYINDDIEDLSHLYCKEKEKADSRKAKRTVLICACLLLLYHALFCFIAGPDGLAHYLILFVPAVFFSIIHFFVNLSIFQWLISKEIQDNEHIEFIEKRLRFTEERLKTIAYDDLGNLFAKRLWHYAQQFSIYACIVDPKTIAIICAALLYSVKELLDEHYLTRHVKHSFVYTMPSQYLQASKGSDFSKAVFSVPDEIIAILLEEQNHLASDQEIASFLRSYNIPNSDNIRAFQEAQYNAKRYIRTILRIRYPSQS